MTKKKASKDKSKKKKNPKVGSLTGRRDARKDHQQLLRGKPVRRSALANPPTDGIKTSPKPFYIDPRND